jgi:N-acetylglucosamine malate deacetylase 1
MISELNVVLVVAPHADDETLGCGGSIARFVAEGRTVVVALMTGATATPHPLFSAETLGGVRAEFEAAMTVLGVTRTVFGGLPSTLLTEMPVHEINRAAGAIVAEVKPDLVLLPFEHDLHRDHGILNYAFRVALRSHLPGNRKPHAVLCYETPTETHLQHPQAQDGFEPNLWIDVSDHIECKLEALACYVSQMAPLPSLRGPGASGALATWRGAQIGVRAAEAFSIVRQVA